MATKKKAPKKNKAAARPAAKNNGQPAILKAVNTLVNAPNSAGGTITEVLAAISGNMEKELLPVLQILHSGHSNGEKVELLRNYLKDKV